MAIRTLLPVLGIIFFPFLSKAHAKGADAGYFHHFSNQFPTEPPEITCIAPTCKGGTATYRTGADCDTYLWNISPNGSILDGGGPSDDFVTVQWNDGPAGQIQLTVTGCTGDIAGMATAEVAVISPQIAVKGPQSVCPGAVEEYSLPAIDGTAFHWSVPSQATILNGQGTHQLTVQWAAYTGALPLLNLIEVEYENCFLGCSGTGAISVQVKQPSFIVGPAEISVNDSPIFKLKKANNPESVPAKWQILNADSAVVWSSGNAAPQILPTWNFTPGNYLLRANPVSTGGTCSTEATLPVKLVSSASTGGIRAVRFNVFGQPVAYFNENYSACEGEDIFLEMPAGPNQSCQWSNGSTGPLLALTNSNGNLLPPGTHEFSVTITDWYTGLTSVAGPFKVTVNPAPANVSISFDPAGPLCEGTETIFSVNNPQSGLNYGWNTGQSGPTLTATAAGAYFVEASNQYGCRAKSNSIEIHPAPDAGSVPSGCFTNCAMLEICLPDIPEVTDYQWFLNGEMLPAPAGNAASLNATVSGSYHVQMTSILGCTSNSDVLSLTLAPVTDSLNLKVCRGGNATFHGVEISPGETLTFNFTSFAGCDSIVAVTVSEWPHLSFELFANETCPGANDGLVNVEIASGALPCRFSLDGEIFQPEPELTGLTSGEHTVTVEDANGCMVSQNIDIQEKTPLEVRVDDYVFPCDAASVTLRPTVLSHAGPLEWLWHDGSQKSWCRVEQAGVYKFKVSDECATFERAIRVSWGDGLPENYLYVPNAFSPNGDAVNDWFRVYPAQGVEIQSLEMKIFDRWGNQLFETREPEKGWNGAARGQLLPVGVYVWRLNATVATCGRNIEISKSGDVTVLR
jgi:gliding motility-associated-like protein